MKIREQKKNCEAKQNELVDHAPPAIRVFAEQTKIEYGVFARHKIYEVFGYLK